MIKSQFKILPLILDSGANKYKLLSDNDTLSWLSIDIEPNLDIQSCLDNLICLYINTDKQIIHNFKLTDIFLSNVLEIYYIVFITYNTTINNGTLIETQSALPLLPNNAKKIISLL